MTNEIKKIEIKDMKVGDKIAVAYEQRHLFKIYKYSIWRIETVKRITPKKTKVITDYTEHDKYDRCAIPSEETERQTKITKASMQIDNILYNLSQKNLISQSDEKILEINAHLEEIMKIIKS